MVYDVRFLGGNRYVKGTQDRVSISTNVGLQVDITAKQFSRYFKGMVSPDETVGVSGIVDFFNEGDVNEIKENGVVVKSTKMTSSDKIVRNVAIVTGDLGIRTVATAIAIQATMNKGFANSTVKEVEVPLRPEILAFIAKTKLVTELDKIEGLVNKFLTKTLKAAEIKPTAAELAAINALIPVAVEDED